MGRVAHDEVAVRDRAVGCRKRQLGAQVANRGGRIAPDGRRQLLDLVLDGVDASVDCAALETEPEALEDVRDDDRASVPRWRWGR
jgi:hypothetical protein